MFTIQIALVVVFTIAIGGGMFYFMMQPKTMVQRQSDYVAVATALTLVNTTTGMGMTAALSKCE